MLASTAAVLAVLATPLPAPWHVAWRARLLDLGHIPLFAALTWAIAHFWPDRRLAWLVATAFGIAVAAAGEIVQASFAFLGRSGDFDDFARGAAGCAFAGLAAWTISKPRGGRRLVAGCTACIIVLGVPIAMASPILLDAWQASREFPVLVDFRGRFSHLRFKSKQAKLDVRHGKAAIHFESGEQPFPTIDFYPPFVDWRGYQKLSIEVEAVAGPVDLSLSICDFRRANGYKERFNRDNIKIAGKVCLDYALADIAAGPITNPLDLSQVQVIRFFIPTQSAPASLVLHRIELSN